MVHEKDHEGNADMYSMEGQNFVCENGKNRYGRPLYGQPGLFFTYAGDGPEWALSRPGKTGNLLIGIVPGKTTKVVDQRRSYRCEILSRHLRP